MNGLNKKVFYLLFSLCFVSSCLPQQGQNGDSENEVLEEGVSVSNKNQGAYGSDRHGLKFETKNPYSYNSYESSESEQQPSQVSASPQVNVVGNNNSQMAQQPTSQALTAKERLNQYYKDYQAPVSKSGSTSSSSVTSNQRNCADLAHGTSRLVYGYAQAQVMSPSTCQRTSLKETCENGNLLRPQMMLYSSCKVISTASSDQNVSIQSQQSSSQGLNAHSGAIRYNTDDDIWKNVDSALMASVKSLGERGTLSLSPDRKSFIVEAELSHENCGKYQSRASAYLNELVSLGGDISKLLNGYGKCLISPYVLRTTDANNKEKYDVVFLKARTSSNSPIILGNDRLFEFYAVNQVREIPFNKSQEVVIHTAPEGYRWGRDLGSNVYPLTNSSIHRAADLTVNPHILYAYNSLNSTGVVYAQSYFLKNLLNGKELYIDYSDVGIDSSYEKALNYLNLNPHGSVAFMSHDYRYSSSTLRESYRTLENGERVKVQNMDDSEFGLVWSVDWERGSLSNKRNILSADDYNYILNNHGITANSFSKYIGIVDVTSSDEKGTYFLIQYSSKGNQRFFLKHLESGMFKKLDFHYLGGYRNENTEFNKPVSAKISRDGKYIYDSSLKNGNTTLEYFEVGSSIKRQKKISLGGATVVLAEIYNHGMLYDLTTGSTDLEKQQNLQKYFVPYNQMGL